MAHSAERERIEARRIAAGLTRPELAALVGVTPQTIHYAERVPTKVVAKATLAKIYNALDAREAQLTASRETPASSPVDEARVAGLEQAVATLTSQVLEVLERLRRLPGGPEQQPGGLQGLEPRPPTRRPVR